MWWLLVLWVLAGHLMWLDIMLREDWDYDNPPLYFQEALMLMGLLWVLGPALYGWWFFKTPDVYVTYTVLLEEGDGEPEVADGWLPDGSWKP